MIEDEMVGWQYQLGLRQLATLCLEQALEVPQTEQEPCCQAVQPTTSRGRDPRSQGTPGSLSSLDARGGARLSFPS